MTHDERPSLDGWLKEFKASPEAAGVGMYLAHNGVVRGFARADGTPVTGMDLSVDRDALERALAQAREMPGIEVVRAHVFEGSLEVGDDIMYVLVGGDFREHVFGALQALVGMIKSEVVVEHEIL